MRLRKEWRDVTKWLLTGYRVHSLDYSFFIILICVFLCLYLYGVRSLDFSFFIISVCLLLSVFAFVFAVSAC